MSVNRDELGRYLDELLDVGSFQDYAPNGLQVEGRKQISRIVVGVSANQALIDSAIAADADALLVHHGFFWKNEPRTLTGIRAKRVRALMVSDISLFGYHLPLDAHPTVGNNVGVLRAIGCPPTGNFSAGHSIDGWIGEPEAPMALKEVLAAIERFSVGPPLVLGPRPETIHRVGICTGGGASFFEAAAAAGCDLFISGEPSEMAKGLAHELGVTFVAAGHHATERFGPQLLGEHLSDKFDINVEFVDISNPV